MNLKVPSFRIGALAPEGADLGGPPASPGCGPQMQKGVGLGQSLQDQEMACRVRQRGFCWALFPEAPSDCLWLQISEERHPQHGHLVKSALFCSIPSAIGADPGTRAGQPPAGTGDPLLCSRTVEAKAGP